jgi:hypothetical protein
MNGVDRGTLIIRLGPSCQILFIQLRKAKCSDTGIGPINYYSIILVSSTSSFDRLRGFFLNLLPLISKKNRAGARCTLQIFHNAPIEV